MEVNYNEKMLQIQQLISGNLFFDQSKIFIQIIYVKIERKKGIIV